MQTLPEGYKVANVIDLSKNRRVLLILNILSIPTSIAFMLTFGWAIMHMRPELNNMMLQEIRFDQPGFILTMFFIIIALTLLAHELVHGFFFWYYTHSRPHFGFRGLYAYAAAPGWYIARNPFIIIGLAPLIILSLLGLLLILICPLSWLPAIFLALIINAGGAIGDLYITWLLLRSPQTTIIQDLGDSMTFYHTS